MRVDIRSRWDNACVLFTHEVAKDEKLPLRAALIAAVSSGANLRGANLRGANLRGADLRGADLRGADLGDANLRGANLGGANLGGADLGGANLGGANLGGANLGGADLRGADLRDADLRDANLRGANLGGANLRGANLGGAKNAERFRDDIWAVLSAAPHEVPGLLEAVRAGRIDGSAYQGACACLVGTIANVRHCSYAEVPGLKPDSSRLAEQWFLQLRPGDTPEKSPAARQTEEWIQQWLDAMRAAFGPPPVPAMAPAGKPIDVAAAG